ncbi:MAG: C-GCAxxG-C-C family protein [Turicibacter sp.]|nr:C-GCAxxG-C-C family protein [Turicibacter sp.]
MNKEISIALVRQGAEEIYRTGELQCAEAVVHAIIQHVDPTMPKELIPAVSGFSVGVGRSQCMCSTVSAAVLCLGYYFGRTFPTTPTDPDSLKTMSLAHELQDSFRGKNKVLCCRILRKDAKEDERLEKCVGMIGDMAAKTAEIIARELNLKVIA